MGMAIAAREREGMEIDIIDKTPARHNNFSCESRYEVCRLRCELRAILGCRFAISLLSCCPYLEQVAQLKQRDCAAGCIIVFAKSRRLELGNNILRAL